IGFASPSGPCDNRTQSKWATSPLGAYGCEPGARDRTPLAGGGRTAVRPYSRSHRAATCWQRERPMTDVQERTSIDEYAVDSPRLREFIEAVKAIRTSHDDPKAIITGIRPHFAALLADQTWLPTMYQEPHPEGGMGSGIGTWLLYRTTDGTLALSSLVVPPGARTPVHDHLAWGLVGLYKGEQDEEVFTRRD